MASWGGSSRQPAAGAPHYPASPAPAARLASNLPEELARLVLCLVARDADVAQQVLVEILERLARARCVEPTRQQACCTVDPAGSGCGVACAPTRGQSVGKGGGVHGWLPVVRTPLQRRRVAARLRAIADSVAIEISPRQRAAGPRQACSRLRPAVVAARQPGCARCHAPPAAWPARRARRHRAHGASAPP